MAAAASGPSPHAVGSRQGDSPTQANRMNTAKGLSRQ